MRIIKLAVNWEGELDKPIGEGPDKQIVTLRQVRDNGWVSQDQFHYGPPPRSHADIATIAALLIQGKKVEAQQLFDAIAKREKFKQYDAAMLRSKVWDKVKETNPELLPTKKTASSAARKGTLRLCPSCKKNKIRWLEECRDCAIAARTPKKTPKKTPKTAQVAPLGGGFLTPWEYNSTHELDHKTHHLWECKHREGYTAYALTLQPDRDSGRPYVKPTGTGHYAGEEGLKNKTGIIAQPNNPNNPNNPNTVRTAQTAPDFRAQKRMHEIAKELGWTIQDDNGVLSFYGPGGYQRYAPNKANFYLVDDSPTAYQNAILEMRRSHARTANRTLAASLNNRIQIAPGQKNWSSEFGSGRYWYCHDKVTVDGIEIGTIYSTNKRGSHHTSTVYENSAVMGSHVEWLVAQALGAGKLPLPEAIKEPQQVSDLAPADQVAQPSSLPGSQIPGALKG